MSTCLHKNSYSHRHLWLTNVQIFKILWMCLSGCLSVYLSVHLSVRLSVRLSVIFFLRNQSFESCQNRSNRLLTSGAHSIFCRIYSYLTDLNWIINFDSLTKDRSRLRNSLSVQVYATLSMNQWQRIRSCLDCNIKIKYQHVSNQSNDYNPANNLRSSTWSTSNRK